MTITLTVAEEMTPRQVVLFGPDAALQTTLCIVPSSGAVIGACTT